MLSYQHFIALCFGGASFQGLLLFFKAKFGVWTLLYYSCMHGPKTKQVI